MRVVLTGAGGLLGSAFVEALPASDLIRIPRVLLERGDVAAILECIGRRPIDVLINCAAHTNLEAAEVDSRIDRKVNAELPAILGQVCRSVGARLVHFSSTGCYGDWKTQPYVETDHLHPLTAHHLAKAAGEALIRSSGCEHVILRTGWLYGGSPDQPKNFVWKRLVEAAGASTMTSDTSQRGCPTFAGDLVGQTMRVLEAGALGTYNATSHGSASRFEYVSAIVASAGLACRVKPGPAFKRLAPVSPNEMSLNTALQQAGLDVMPEWRAALETHVNDLLRSSAWAVITSTSQNNWPTGPDRQMRP